MKEVCAGIVVYNPDEERLRSNVKAIINQVDSLVLVVNGAEYEANVEEYKSYDSVEILVNQKNMGIAYALNQIMKYGYDKGYKWVVTLDQDSEVPEGFVEGLYKYNSQENVGIIAPNYYDLNSGLHYSTDNPEYWEVYKCITSGALTSVDAWKKVRGFTNELFIDYVDHEFCAKLIIAGFRTIIVRDVVLTHEVGHARIVEWGKHRYTLLNESPFRVYYFVRNVIYYYKSYPEVINYKHEKKELRVRCIMILLCEKQKLAKLKSIVKGFIDASGFYRHMKKNDKIFRG